MTTIDSDSESQDSDDGRRFRFEATRKDDTLRLQSQNKRRSDQSKPSNYRSRSGDRGNHNRRDYDKGRQQERDRKEGGDRDKRKNSKERESRDNKYSESKSNSKDSRHGTKGNLKDVKDSHESKTLIENEKRSNHCKDPVRNSSNSKDYKNSKDSRSRESKNSNTRALKDTKIRESKDQDLKSPRDRETKTSRDPETKDRERGSKRSRDLSHETLSTAKHGHRSREKYKSRERTETSREKGKQFELEKAKDERSKNSANKRSPRKGTEKKNIKRDTHSPSKILEQIGSDSESDLGALDPDVGPVMALDTFEDCREMNLSDFDIISDTEGSSSDTTDAKLPTEGPIIKGEILAPHYYGPKITKRVSRRQYERLVRRQAALNTRRLEELYKVNRENNDDIVAPLAPSNNNPSAVSDFLLGPEAVGEHRRSLNMEDEKLSDYSSEDQESEDNKFNMKKSKYRDSKNINYLKIDELRLDNENKSSSNTNIYHPDQSLDRKIYGPSLPPKCLKGISSHPEIESGLETAVKNLEAVSFSFDIGHSQSIDNISPYELKKNIINKNRQIISPSDSRRSDNLKKEINEPKNIVIGPSLPPGIKINSESAESESEEFCSSLKKSDIETGEENVKIIGPSLPPHLKQENSKSVITSKTCIDSTSPSQQNVVFSSNSIFGPTLPPYLMSNVSQNTKQNSDSDCDEEVLGPLPPDHPAAMNDYIQRQLEDRAKRMKDKLDSKNSVVDKREEWMLELPSAQAANLGLGSKRQFRNKAGPDMSDRSSWTDTPADKIRKKHDKLSGKLKTTDPAKESERLAIQERDKAMEKMAEKHASKKRKESLLEIHKKKLHKKKKKEEKEAKNAVGKQTRRPFDRDVDLQANRFDEAQKKSILKKAQLLNDRFSRGESKFL